MINGQGYPVRHYHRNCHKASNLVHVCDVYDALRTRRPYRDAWESERVLTYIEERAGTEFEPDMAGAFVKMMRKVEGGIQLSPVPPAAGVTPVAPAAGGTPAPQNGTPTTSGSSSPAKTV